MGLREAEGEVEPHLLILIGTQSPSDAEFSGIFSGIAYSKIQPTRFRNKTKNVNQPTMSVLDSIIFGWRLAVQKAT